MLLPGRRARSAHQNGGGTEGVVGQVGQVAPERLPLTGARWGHRTRSPNRGRRETTRTCYPWWPARLQGAAGRRRVAKDLVMRRSPGVVQARSRRLPAGNSAMRRGDTDPPLIPVKGDEFQLEISRPEPSHEIDDRVAAPVADMLLEPPARGHSH